MKISTKKLVLNALMIAVVFLITYLPFLRIPSPIPGGYFNIGDAAIMITAILLGKKSGFIAGAIGSALADLACGSFIFVPITFIVKGLEGYIVGAIANKNSGRAPSRAVQIISLAVGALVMVLGYFVFELTIIRLIDKSLAFTAIVAEIPGNLIQGAVSAILAYAFITIMFKTNIGKQLRNN
ncbi:MAG TPA: ECF transporter S component [Ruminiclostridium sp.]